MSKSKNNRYRQAMLGGALVLGVCCTGNAATYTWSNRVSGDWNDKTLWSPTGVPSASDFASIVRSPRLPPPHQITVNSPNTIATMALNDNTATLNIPSVGNLTVSDSFTDANGSINGTMVFDSPSHTICNLYVDHHHTTTGTFLFLTDGNMASGPGPGGSGTGEVLPGTTVIARSNAAGVSTGTTMNIPFEGSNYGTITLDADATAPSTAITKLTVYNGGAYSNFGTINFDGGATPSFERWFAGNLTNNPGAVVNLSGGSTLFFGSTLNTGTITTSGGQGSFFGVTTNSGAFVASSATNWFANLSITSTGYLQGGAGDHFIIAADFSNQSTQTALWDTSASTLLFQNSGNPTLHNVTLYGDGSAFKWGTIELYQGNSVNLIEGDSVQIARSMRVLLSCQLLTMALRICHFSI
jgi:hypothetical protein